MHKEWKEENKVPSKSPFLSSRESLSLNLMRKFLEIYVKKTSKLLGNMLVECG
jgi:hypothetical protein